MGPRLFGLAALAAGCGGQGTVVGDATTSRGESTSVGTSVGTSDPATTSSSSSSHELSESSSVTGSLAATTSGGRTGDSGGIGGSSTSAAEGGQPGGYVEVAVALGIDAVQQSEDSFATQGQAWGDFDGDGVLDLALTSQLAPNYLFRGVNGRSFEPVDWGGEPLALAGSVSTGAVFVDYDNDSWPDLYVLARGANSMLRNQQGQGFVDATTGTGLGDVGFGETAAWADYDGDGLLDVYIANNDITLPDRLFHNEGDGGFSDVSATLDVEVRTRLGFSATFFDYDLDGDPDLYVGNDKHQGNVLWRNDGPGCGAWCFTDVSAESDAGIEMGSMGIAVGDYDNDGDQDMFVSDLGPMVLLNNQAAQGSPGFVEVAEASGALVDEEMWFQYGWGAQFVDYDNDGWLDLYVALGRLTSGPTRPNVMLRNNGDGTFNRLNHAAGAQDPGRSQGLAIADFDEDGWVDLLVGNQDGPYALFQNKGTEGTWLELALRGDGSIVSTDAVGALVAVTDDSGRTQTREVIVGSSLGAGSSARLHFGFGETTPVSMSVRWPDGTVDNRDEVSVNTLLSVEY